MSSNSEPKPPPSLSLFTSLQSPSKSPFFHRTLVLLITFLAYTSFHASRKPPSIVKSVLGPDLRSTNASAPIDQGWPPFNGSDGTHRLGELDLVFLLAYSFGMYFSGHLGDRYDLRVFLSIGMLGSGLLTIAFGFGYWFDVHMFSYFLAVQIVCGLFQSTGWPCVVAVVGNWFGEGENGMIMGIWNSHASFGNILGSIVASWLLQFGWGWCFLLPGLFVIFMSGIVYVFLVVSPEILGFGIGSSNGEIELLETDQEFEDESSRLLQSKYPNTLEETKIIQSSDAIGFLEAWRLPGVASYSLCLFFSKLVGYTFLYWLPFYIRHTAVAGVHFSHKTAGMLSTIFDIGGVLGGILSGYISDKIEARAVTSILFFTLSIFSLILYRVYGSISMFSNIFLLFLSGVLVNGPYALITTAVAADLGSNNTVGGNSRALATVAAIIDGTGSVGASIGPLLTGYMSTRGWNSVFVMLIMSIFVAELFLIHIAKAEIEAKRAHKKWFWRKS